METASLPTEITQIRLSDEERISGELEIEKLQEAIITLHRDGLSFLDLAYY